MNKERHSADERSLVEAASRAFDAELHTPAYADTHANADHLDWLMSALCKTSPRRVLDLGTGNGYAALEAAKQLPAGKIIGLDVAALAIGKNKARASGQGITNIAFKTYDGTTLPYPDDHFEGVVCRYAFHHMPRPGVTLSEVSRVLCGGGPFVFSDAVKSKLDHTDFINAFQLLKADGHVAMLDEITLLQKFNDHGFDAVRVLNTTLSFDRAWNEHYEALIRGTPKIVLEAYNLSVDGSRILLTIPILNAVLINQQI